jgi:cytochrome P450
MLGEGIFTQDGRPWKHSRELLRRQFVRIHRQDSQVFDAHVEDLIAKLSCTSGVVDLQPYFLRFTLATTTALIFGEPVISVPGEETDSFEKSFDYASYISAIRLRLADLEWIWKPARFKEACSVIKEYAMNFVQLALKDMEDNGQKAASEKYAFIIDLFKEMQDPSLVRDQLVHVLIAGRDTTACLMSWAFFLLVRHPESLAKLRTEIQDVTGGSFEISRATISKMKYLRCVINESKHI